MFPRVTQWTRNFLNDVAGVSAIEYCVLFCSVAFLIIFAGLNGVAPGVSHRLGDAFKPEVVLSGEGICPAHHHASGDGTGNCGVGLGGGGGNGTPNEGNGQGPGPEHEKGDNPGHGPS